MAPSPMGKLQQQSLATAPSGLKDHDWTRWQAAAADGMETLPYDLGINEVGAVLGHRDAIEDGCFHTHLKAMVELFRNSAAAAHPGLRLLCRGLKLPAHREPHAGVGGREDLASVLKAQGAGAIEIKADLSGWAGPKGEGPVALAAIGAQVAFRDHTQPGIQLPVGA